MNGQSFYLFFLPVIGAKPVEGRVQLDDVSTKKNKISNLRYSFL